ncbi:MAG: hypothetical protein OEU26_07895 [Candidatus Tectomicrobia bacterium]|nr:hypothetical protein [Candidatus Tectomicrobia bacterium]
MASHTAETTDAAPRNSARIQRRHTIAAVVYFLYGLFYLFGAQYITSMVESTGRGPSNSWLFFVLGGVIAVLFPLLIYSRFAFAFSLRWPFSSQRKTVYISFTLLLGILVVARVAALFNGGLYLQTRLHTAALVIAAINAAVLLWAGLSQPAWITRDAEGAN